MGVETPGEVGGCGCRHACGRVRVYVCVGGGVGVCVSGTVCSRVEVLVKSGTIHLNCRHKTIRN